MFINFDDYHYYCDANEMWAKSVNLIKNSHSYFGIMQEIKEKIKKLEKIYLSFPSQDHDFLRYKYFGQREADNYRLLENLLELSYSYINIQRDFIEELIKNRVDVWLKENNDSFYPMPYIFLEINKEKLWQNEGILRDSSKTFFVLIHKEIFKNFINNTLKSYRAIEHSDLQRILHLDEGKALQYALTLSEQFITDLHKNGDANRNWRTPLADHIKEKFPKISSSFSQELSRLLGKIVNPNAQD